MLSPPAGLCSQPSPLWPDFHWRPESPPTTSLPYRRFGLERLPYLTLISGSHLLSCLFLLARPTFHLDWQSPKHPASYLCFFMGGPTARNDLSPSMSSPCLFLFNLSSHSSIVTFSEKRNAPGKDDPLCPQSLVSCLLNGTAQVILKGCLLY